MNEANRRPQERCKKDGGKETRGRVDHSIRNWSPEAATPPLSMTIITRFRDGPAVRAPFCVLPIRNIQEKPARSRITMGTTCALFEFPQVKCKELSFGLAFLYVPSSEFLCVGSMTDMPYGGLPVMGNIRVITLYYRVGTSTPTFSHRCIFPPFPTSRFCLHVLDTHPVTFPTQLPAPRYIHVMLPQ